MSTWTAATVAVPAASAAALSGSEININEIRPYRSRRNRPCDYCRRRKIRCTMISPGNCTLCQKNGSKCTFVNEPEKKHRRSDKKPEEEESHLPPKVHVGPMEPPAKRLKRDEAGRPLIPNGFDSGAIMGLTGDQDPYLLRYYSYDENETNTFIKHALRRVTKDEHFPIHFFAFKDERGERVRQEERNQRQRVTQLAGEYEERLLALYFRYVHPTYPILDKDLFYDDYYNNKENIHVGLLAGLLALSCMWWKYDSKLCVRSMPPQLGSQLYKECSIAVERDVKYPGTSIAQCLLLLLQRRLLLDETADTYALTVDMARLVSVSHSLGLHLDSSQWSIPDSEKNLRRQLWTCLYIMEKWTAANTGQPSLLNEENCTQTLYTSAAPEDQLFVALGKLTLILGKVLNELYGIKSQHTLYSDPETTNQKVDNFFRILYVWEEMLPPELKTMKISAGEEFCRNGSLRLAQLTLEVLLHRIRLRPNSFKLPDYPTYRAKATETIQKIIKFTSEITHSHLHAFWYSTTRLSFSSIAHFVFYHYLTSPTAQEYKRNKEVLRKWLWALRVLSQGWEEGAGLAVFRLDVILWMEEGLFADPTPGIREQQDKVQAEREGRVVGEALPLRVDDSNIPQTTPLITGKEEELGFVEDMLLLHEDIMSGPEQMNQLMNQHGMLPAPDDLIDSYGEYFHDPRSFFEPSFLF